METKETFWSQYADSFEELNNYVVGKGDVKIMQEAIAEIKDIGQVLELACGNGTYTKSLALNAEHIVATDFSEEMVRATQERLASFQKIKVEQANALQLHYNDTTFDTVFMANLVHVIPDYNQLMKEVYRVLKPNGRIIVLDFTMQGMSFFNKIGMVYRFMKTYGKPTDKAQKSNFSLKEMINLLEKSKFRIEEAELIGEKSKAVFVTARK